MLKNAISNIDFSSARPPVCVHGDAAVALRARMVLMVVDDPRVSRVAERLGVDRATVRMWRDRFLKIGVRGLFDKRRSGRPRVISDVDRCALIAMACGRPKEFGIEFRRTWTTDDLRATFRMRHPTVPMRRRAFRPCRGASRPSGRPSAAGVAASSSTSATAPPR